MNLAVVALSVCCGMARGTKLGDLLAYRWAGLGFFATALALQAVLGHSYAESLPVLRQAAPILHLSSMALLLAGLWRNRELWGTRVAAAGVLLNLAVVFANGGKMPVSLTALDAVQMPAARLAYLVAGRSLTHAVMRPGTALGFLADVLYLPPPLRRSPVFSVGDIVLAGGLFLLIQDAMARSARSRAALTSASP
jgi:hypothetical protein